jgi:hypothetical protein
LSELSTTFPDAIFASFQNAREDRATPLGYSFGLVIAHLRRGIQTHTNLPKKFGNHVWPLCKRCRKPVNYKFKKIFEFSLHQKLDPDVVRNGELEGQSPSSQDDPTST